MTAYLIRRGIFGVILIFLSTIVSFTILKMSPGRAGAADFDPRLSRAYIEQNERLFGLDRPAYRQYLDWLGVGYFLGGDHTRKGLLQGDFGLSMRYKQPVVQVVASRLGATLSLNVISILLTWVVALPLGIYAAIHYQKWADRFLSAISFMGMSLPGFFMALVVLWLFALKFQVIPAGGLRSIDHTAYNEKMGEVASIERAAKDDRRALSDSERDRVNKLRSEADWHMQRLGPGGRLSDYLRHLALPAIVLTITALASLQRVMRGNMIETLRQQYIVTARAKGLSENRVIYKHALRNAINPLITLLGLEFAALFTGAAILENVINFPGMGQLILEALRAKDQALVMASFLIGSIMLVIGNLLADVLLAYVDPRVSYD